MFIGVLIQDLMQSDIHFDAPLSNWRTGIATGILLFAFIGLRHGMPKLPSRARARKPGSVRT
jgi:hypothetical protein